MKKLLSIILTFTVFAFNSCKKDTGPSTTNTQPTNNALNRSINGSAQKGPFVNGTSITVYELGQNYSQTGKSFNTQINGNSGSFQLNNIALITNYIQIRADGFYFNEICGSNSSSQITLDCIANVGNSGTLHINLLTHLEMPRVEYLLTTGLPFDSAKNKAQREVLNIFNISLTSIQHSETLDISQTGDGNAVLLAISSILQGFRTESELSSLLALISNDIKNDGILNDSSAKSSLIDHALLIDTISIRNNISNFYLNLGVSASIPHFEKYINQFIISTNFIPTNSVMTFPATGAYGNNILFKNQTTYSGLDQSFTGQLKKCAYLKIRIHVISGSQFGNVLGTSNNLSISNYDNVNNQQFYTVIDPTLPFDLHLNFNGPPAGGGGSYLIEYFEKNSTTPTFSKTITVS